MFRSKCKIKDKYSFPNTLNHMYQEEKNILSRDWEQVQTEEQLYQIFQLAALVSVTQAALSFPLSSKQSSVKEHNSLLFWSLQTASNLDNFSKLRHHRKRQMIPGSCYFYCLSLCHAITSMPLLQRMTALEQLQWRRYKNHIQKKYIKYVLTVKCKVVAFSFFKKKLFFFFFVFRSII